MPIYTLGNISPAFDARKTNFIADNAELIGNIQLARNASVWFGAVLRGDNELIYIGENTNVQDGCMCHTDMGYPLTVGENCTIGHKAILHGCTIESNSLIGMGAIILNGAKIGRNCVIGAGALIGENKIIPDNSLVVGMPGKVIRTLTQEDADRITQSAHHYVANAHRFMTELKVAN